jgi:hypothetical protein
MASPGHSFGTHDCGSPFLGQLDELIEGLLKLRCLHVISEATKAGISPTGIDRVTTRVPQTAKSSYVPITNSRFLKRAGQRVAVELGIVPRAWDGSNID